MSDAPTSRGRLTPLEFAAKWGGSSRSERAAAQEHFIDICRMLGVQTPNQTDRYGATCAVSSRMRSRFQKNGWLGSIPPRRRGL